MAQWLSWLERRPVTAEVTSSSLVWVDYADMAQLAEQLICNQQVFGSSPNIGSYFFHKNNMEGFPSGQRGQTVNLLLYASVVRIHLLPLISQDMLNLGS